MSELELRLWQFSLKFVRCWAEANGEWYFSRMLMSGSDALMRELEEERRERAGT